MNTKILETLEFNKIKALFEPHLLTEQGLEELKGLAPTAKVDKIKQAFFTTKQTGTGLGVFLANEIITAHQGTLDYLSEKNKGTRVVITLPIT